MKACWLLIWTSGALGLGACANFEPIGLYDGCDAPEFGPTTRAEQTLTAGQYSAHRHAAPGAAQVDAAPADAAQADGAADWLLIFYQDHLRRNELPGQGCPFYPSCSAFARSAFHHHAPPVALMLTVDRLLIREHYAIAQQYPQTCTQHGDTRLHDPVPGTLSSAPRSSPALISRVPATQDICLGNANSPHIDGLAIELRRAIRR